MTARSWNLRFPKCTRSARVYRASPAYPVGVTRYREGLYPLETFNKDTACAAIEILERWGR